MDQVPDSVSDVLMYPEHHAVWLDAMGISRWTTTLSLNETASVVSEATLERLSERTVGAEVTAVVVDEPALPEIIQTACYWVIGSSPLAGEECRLLAGMMLAIQAVEGEVIYSTVQDDGVAHIQATGLMTWPRLNVCHVPQLGVMLPDTLKVLLLGDVVFPEGHDRVWRIPALADMLSEPLLKREAWAGLKAMWAWP